MAAEIEAWPETGPLWLDAPVISVDGVTISAPGTEDAAWTGFLVRPAPGGLKALRPATGADWPALPDDAVIRIAITAGWTAELLPETIKTAIVQTAAHWFNVRETVNIGNITSEIPETGRKLLKPWRWRVIG